MTSKTLPRLGPIVGAALALCALCGCANTITYQNARVEDPWQVTIMPMGLVTNASTGARPTPTLPPPDGEVESSFDVLPGQELGLNWQAVRVELGLPGRLQFHAALWNAVLGLEAGLKWQWLGDQDTWLNSALYLHRRLDHFDADPVAACLALRSTQFDWLWTVGRANGWQGTLIGRVTHTDVAYEASQITTHEQEDGTTSQAISRSLKASGDYWQVGAAVGLTTPPAAFWGTSSALHVELALLRWLPQSGFDAEPGWTLQLGVGWRMGQGE